MRRTTSSSAVSALSRGTGSSKPAASGYRRFRGSAGSRHPSFNKKARRRRGTPGAVLRAAEAEAQAEAARAMIGADMGPDVNGATSPVHGARNRKGCTEVARKEKPPTSPQVRGLDDAVSRYSHSFTLVCHRTVPVDFSWVVGFCRFAAEYLRVSSRRCLGQILRQIRKLFRNRKRAVSFSSQEQKRVSFEAQNHPNTGARPIE